MTRAKQDADSAVKPFLENSRRTYEDDRDLGHFPTEEDVWAGKVLEHCEKNKIPLPKKARELERLINFAKTWPGKWSLPKGPEPVWNPFRIAVLRLEYRRLRNAGRSAADSSKELQTRPPWSQMFAGDSANGSDPVQEKMKENALVLAKEWELVVAEKRDKLLADGDWEALEIALSTAKWEAEWAPTASTFAAALQRLKEGFSR